MVSKLPSTRCVSKASSEGDLSENMAKADISASVKGISTSPPRSSAMLAKLLRTKPKSASADRCLRPLGATIDMTPPTMRTSNRFSEKGIFALMFTKRQLGYRGDYWVSSPSGNCWDTTSFSLTGAYVPETDTQAIAITHGYSKDHRPDLKQAVLELMVAQDGGVPLMSQSWDGNASDTVVFKERCEALLTQFAASETPRYLIADAKLSTEANAPNLARFPFIPRIPETLNVTQQVIEQA